MQVDRGELLAVEALARWTHPRLGEIPPSCIIPLAETTGLIVPLGRKLLGVAVRQAALWRARNPQICRVININISPLQFASDDVIAHFMTLLEQNRLPADGFCIEVTESAFMNETAIRALDAARGLGFKVAMDDFGMGYSSLSQLPRLPLSWVKLDRSFVSSANGKREASTGPQSFLQWPVLESNTFFPVVNIVHRECPSWLDDLAIKGTIRDGVGPLKRHVRH
jgi:EAL domain-containing protein (putative c-di-GMP-specific phosphodiesterase class I)